MNRYSPCPILLVFVSIVPPTMRCGNLLSSFPKELIIVCAKAGSRALRDREFPSKSPLLVRSCSIIMRVTMTEASHASDAGAQQEHVSKNYSQDTRVDPSPAPCRGNCRETLFSCRQKPWKGCNGWSMNQTGNLKGTEQGRTHFFMLQPLEVSTATISPNNLVASQIPASENVPGHEKTSFRQLDVGRVHFSSLVQIQSLENYSEA